ncbi:hypothetical protein E4U42_002683 [Claviceps africana]|uniref:Mid2 domain-containing protein n=1 Tax=Claviceps africana TaxID=83212 RepID=A0A8K0NHB9_9HYPO|nr:hypothetical protein E4U42_002683 [Claviceps africana]
MRLNRALEKLLIASAMLSVAQAGWLGRLLNVRQVAEVIDGGSGASSSIPVAAATPNSSPPPAKDPSPPVSSSKTPPKEVASSSTPANLPVAQPSSTSSLPIAISSKPAPPGPGKTSPSVPQSTSLSFMWTPTTPVDTAFISATPVVSTKVEVVTQILSNGSTAIVTTTTRTTSTPGLSSSDGEATGMTTKTRNTVIGLVVGIGGAIVVGALGLVAWRIWGRKKHSEEHDVLMEYDLSSPGAAEKSERGSSVAGTQRTPFQSTLENYHQPTQVNPSSNF